MWDIEHSYWSDVILKNYLSFFDILCKNPGQKKEFNSVVIYLRDNLTVEKPNTKWVQVKKTIKTHIQNKKQLNLYFFE
jgi:ribosomal protein L21